MFRRWKVALPLLLFAIGATLFVGLTAKPDYTMTSYVQLIPAKVAPTDDPTGASLRNPWNQLGLNTLGQASIYATQTQGFLESLKASKHTDNFTLTMTYPNPIVTVEVVGTTPEDARDTTEVVIDRLRQSTLSLQSGAGVGAADLIATQRLDQGQNLLPSTSKVKRAILAVAAGGLILTAGGTVGFDALMRRRARKLKEREAEETDDAPAPEEPMPAEAGSNGKELSSAGKVPVIPGDAMARPLNGVSGGKARPMVDRAPAESVERTAIIKRIPVVREVPKQRRPPASATYRSANARDLANGTNGDDDHAAPKNQDDHAAPKNQEDHAAPKKDDHAAPKNQDDLAAPKDQEDHAAPKDQDGDPAADASDVRVVLQPKWVGNANGGKSK